MPPYRLFHVSTATLRPAKRAAAIRWWREEGRAFYAGLPGVAGVQAYAPQFGLGGTAIEIWLELESYAAYDRTEAAIAAEPGRYAEPFQRATELLEWGPSRLVGEWPESDLLPDA